MNSSLSKPDEPERECEQRRQARISQYRKRDYRMSAQEKPTGRDREQQAQGQAKEPCRKEGAKNVKGRGPATAGTEHYHKQQTEPWKLPD
jgi:hypothetical protein